MKSAIGCLLFLSVIPLRAQDVPTQERATLLAARGERAWATWIRGQAVGWVFSRPHSHVSVSAHLGNGGGHAYVDAYLMSDIGPGATQGDEIAHTTFDLPYPWDGWVDVFTDLDLDQGRYWLVLAKPRDRTHSSINWFVSQPDYVEGSCGVSYGGSQAYTFNFDEAEYIPASKFEKKFQPYAFQFEVTEIRTADSEPCP